MKFTSEDLLKAMGLKITDKIKIGELIFEIKYSQWNGRYLLLNINGSFWLNDIVGEEYEIIQSKPTLTEDEKVELKKWVETHKYISRDTTIMPLFVSENKPVKEEHFVDYGDAMCIKHKMFQFIKPLETYSIEELLKE